MGKYLAYTSPARGHLYPIVDTLIELRRRGHEVAVRTIAAEVQRMERLGFSATAIAPEIEAIEPDDYLARTPVGANTRILKTFARRGEHEIGDLQRAIAEVEPDALLIDVNCQGAATVAEAGQRPWAMWTPYFMPLPSRDAPPFGLGLHPRSDLVGRMRDALLMKIAVDPPLRQAARGVNPLRARLGLAPFRHGSELWVAAPLHLYFTAEPFEYPRSDWPDVLPHARPWHLAASGRAAGLARAARATACARDALDRVSGRRQARGGRAQSTRERRCRGRHHDRGGRSGRFDPPANARVERFVPHGPLIDRAACVVCHGGMGITQRALAAGVPVCVVPFGRDQLEVAGHVTACRAGTRLAVQRLRADRLRAAVKGAMAKRAGAQRIASAFANAGGAPAGADAIEALPVRQQNGRDESIEHLCVDNKLHGVPW